MILHVDMDAFYASVEERDDPGLRGKPVIVGGTPEGRGVVAAANYEARRFGVHSAMPAGRALKLCPHAIVIRPRMNRYAVVSDEIQTILHRYTPLVEPLSLDEAFLDVAGTEGLFGSPVEVARRVKSEILAELQLVASIGVAPNKFLAKIASDLEKPDALVVVDPLHVQEFLDPLPVSRLWGVGKVTEREFKELGVGTIAELRRLDHNDLAARFGKMGEHLWELAHGRDDRRVIPDREAKSISHETTFPEDIVDLDDLRSRLLELTELVGQRLRRQGLTGKTVQIKVRYGDFTTITRSQSLANATCATREIWETAAELLTKKLPQRRLKIRLLGVGVQNLSGNAARQLTLFGSDDAHKQADVDHVSDAIRQKFGSSSLQRGASLSQGSTDSRAVGPGDSDHQGR